MMMVQQSTCWHRAGPALLAVPLLVLAMAAPALAQHAAHGGHVHQNEAALTVAGTWENETDEASLTLGAEYERRFTNVVGLVLEAEYVVDPEAWVVVAPLVVRPGGGGFKLVAGPGLENKNVEAHGRDTFFLFRIGAGYGAEFAGRYAVTPFVNVDLVREHGEWVRAIVAGVTLGVAF
jgi:hypothetical protein